MITENDITKSPSIKARKVLEITEGGIIRRVRKEPEE
jgi:hypothetical protein